MGQEWTTQLKVGSKLLSFAEFAWFFGRYCDVAFLTHEPRVTWPGRLPTASVSCRPARGRSNEGGRGPMEASGGRSKMGRSIPIGIGPGPGGGRSRRGRSAPGPFQPAEASAEGTGAPGSALCTPFCKVPTQMSGKKFRKNPPGKTADCQEGKPTSGAVVPKPPTHGSDAGHREPTWRGRPLVTAIEAALLGRAVPAVVCGGAAGWGS